MGNVLTGKFRVSYPNVFKTKKNDLNGKDEYSVVAIFPKGADLSKLQAACKEAAKEKWGDKIPANLRSPFRKHEERQIENEKGDMIFPAGMEAGGIFINLKSNQRPGVVNERTEDIINESEFYAGCFARATVRPYAYGGPGTKFAPGIAFGLQNIQKMADGEPLGSRTKPQDDFEAIEGAGDTAGSAGGDAASLFG